MESKPLPVLTEDCPCTRNCPRHGNCVECVKNEGEALHGRSFAALFRDKGLMDP